MKRAISLLLCIVMCASVFSTTAATAFALGATDEIFTVEKTDFENDRITYTISLNANQSSISGTILKAEFDSTVLSVSSDSGAIGYVNDYGEFAANVTGYYETGLVYDDANTYSIAYMNPNGFNIGDSSKKFVKITFEAISEERPVTDVTFYCEEFITDDGDDSNDIRKSDGAQEIYSDSFFTLNPAKNVEVASCEQGLKFTWNSAKGAEWYNIYRRQVNNEDGSISDWEKITEIPAGTTEYIDEIGVSIEKGVEYYYSVESANKYGVREYDKTGLPGFFFGTITEIDVEPTERGAMVSWGALNGAESYSVYRNEELETDEDGKLVWEKVGETDGETSCEDEPLTSGVQYYYTVKAHKGQYNAESSVDPATLIFIANATIATCKITQTEIIINWSFVTDAVSYEVYRKAPGETEYTFMEATTDNIYTDTDVEDKQTYSYQVRSIAENGDGSVRGTTGYDVIKLPITTSVTAERGEDHIKVSWAPAELAEEYVVYRKTTTGTWMRMTTVPATQTEFEDTVVDSGVTYIYAIASKAQSFTTEPSDVSNEVYFLSAPVIIGVFNASEGMELRFESVDGAESYNVYRREVDGEFGSPVGTIEQSTLKEYKYTDNTATSGIQYVFGVQSVYGDIESAITESNLACCLDEPQFEIEAAYNGVKVSWDAIRGAEQYIVLSKNRKADDWNITATVTDTSYVHTGAVSGRTNYYAVMAICGDTVSTVTQKNIYYIEAPKDVTFTNYKASVKLQWVDVLGASDYEVYRKLYGESEWTKLDLELEYTEDDSGEDTIIYVSATDKNVTSGKKYVYTIVSVDDEDRSATYEKGWSNRFLKNPTVKAVENHSSGLKISWAKASGAKKYYVYRKTSKSGSWKYMGSTTSTYYVDKKVTSGKRYYYAVKAVDGESAGYHNKTHFNDLCKNRVYLEAPEAVSVKSTKSGVTFKWSKVSGASGYYVYRKTGSGSYTKIATVKGSTKVSYLDKTAKKGKTYRYYVKAYSGSNKSANGSSLKIKDKY